MDECTLAIISLSVLFSENRWDDNCLILITAVSL